MTKSWLPTHGSAPVGKQYASETRSGTFDGTVVALRDITKTYPGVQALTSVDLDIFPGTVHAISGENGAGKSTLSKVICGLVQPDAGRYTSITKGFISPPPATPGYSESAPSPRSFPLSPTCQ